MLTKLEVQNVQSNVLPLTLEDASNGYLVRDIQGLDPVKATITSSQMAQVDGAQPQASRRETRNITMKIGLQPNNTLNHDVASLRTNLYNFLISKALVNLSFYTDGSLYATTTGIVESCTNNMFSADPEVDVSIICYDPDFYAPASVVISEGPPPPSTTIFDGGTWDTVYDESITVDGGTWNSAYNNNLNVDGSSLGVVHPIFPTTKTITYEGTTETGIIFTLLPDRDLSGFTLYNTKPDNTIQKFDFEGTILNGDIITITSIQLRKSAVITRNQTPIAALYFVQAASDWISLDPGDNDIRVSVAGNPVPFSIEYTPKYGAL